MENIQLESFVVQQVFQICLEQTPQFTERMQPYLTEIRSSKLSVMYKDSCTLKDKAALNEIDNKGIATPLLACIANGDIAAVKELLNNSASCNTQNIYGTSPLHLACMSKNKEITELLLQKKCDIDVIDCSGHCALFMAVFLGDEPLVHTLLNHGANVNIQTHSGLSVLLASIQGGQVGIVKVLLDKGAAVNCQDTRGTSPLMACVVCGSHEILKCLIEQQAKVDLTCSTGDTALTLSSLLGHHDCMEELLKNCANINHRNRFGLSALMIAVSQSNVKMTEFLLMKGALLDLKDYSGQTALFHAVNAAFYEGVKILLAAKANTSVLDYSGLTALAIACSRGQKELSQLLVSGQSLCAGPSTQNFNIALESSLKHQDRQLFDYLLENHQELCTNFRGVRGETFLHWVVRFTSNKEMLQKVVNLCCDNVNAKSAGGITALLVAAGTRNSAAVDILVQCKDIEVDCTDINGRSALMEASDKGSLGVVKSLIKCGCNVHLADFQQGWNALMFASQRGFVEVMTCLLEKNIEVGKKSRQGVTAAAICAGNGHWEALMLLLEHGAQVNEGFVKSWIDSNSPLYHAILGKHPSVVKGLVEKGASTRGVTVDNWTTLLLSVHSRCPNIVQYFIRMDQFDVNKANCGGLRPIDIAAFNGDTEILEMLLEAGADPNLSNDNHETALMRAAASSKCDVVRLLLKHRAEVDHCTTDGWTPLMFFAQKGDLECMKMILDKIPKTKIDHQDERGNTALHIAVSNGHIDAVKLLLENCAGPNETNIDGWCPLTICANNGHSEILECLVKAPSRDLEVKTFFGETPLHLTVRTGIRKLVKTLLDNGASVKALTRKKENPLHISAAAGHCAISKTLIDKGVDVDQKDLQGNTALHLCAGKLSCMDLLIKKKADLNKQNNKKQTALQLSCLRKSKECVQFLLRQKSLSDSTREAAKKFAKRELFMQEFVQLIETTVPDLEISQLQEPCLLQRDSKELERESCSDEVKTEGEKKAAIIISKSLQNIPELASKDNSPVVVNIANMYVTETVENMALQNSSIIHGANTAASTDSKADE